MLESVATLDGLIDWFNQIQSESDFWTATRLDIQVAELLNLASREGES